ncbi:MAG: ATP-dependent zinc metalloprotease FtsH [Bacteroidia bacterium]|nr:ATP-dependent zinc metalloprotease FtsH [Bacteroidia bacterium]
MAEKETKNSVGNNIPKGNKKNPGGAKFTPKFNPIYIYGILLLAFFAINYYTNSGTPVETSWQEVKNTMLKNGDIAKIVVVNKSQSDIFLKEGSYEKYKSKLDQGFGSPAKVGPHFFFTIGSVDVFEKNLESAQAEFGDNAKVTLTYETRVNYFSEVMGWLLFPLIMLAIWFWFYRRMSKGGGGGGNIFNVGKSQAKIFDKESRVSTTFKEVAGLAEAKQEIEEIVEFLKNPDRYTKLGGKIPKGALLVGPPGTGKTLLAKAVAGEADVPFFSMSGSDFVEMFVGVGASRVRDLFKQAKEKAPCIVFIDEIDAIGRARGRNPNMGSNDERENTLNQLLTEMDGFDTNSGVIILGATNRADILDRALMRAGRFDRQIHVELPDVIDRKEIFLVHLRPLTLSEDVNVNFLAKQTPGFSGADIANVCNEAALIAARKQKTKVEKQDFLDAVDRIVGGLEKKNKIITADEKAIIAYHEAGHATVSWLLEHAHPLVKVTIVPRGKALGAAWYLPEERQITTREQMLDEVCATLGGRAAETVVFSKISSGAQNDLEKVTKTAYSMICYFGMSDKVGNVSYYDSSGQSDYSFNKPYSEKTAELIDAEIKELIDIAFSRAKDILIKNAEGHKQLAELLLEREVIFTEDMEHIFGPRPWGKKKEEDNPLKEDDTQPTSLESEITKV